jgi:hydroxypyruvate reductase
MPETPAFSFRHRWADLAGRIWHAAVQAVSPEALIAQVVDRAGFHLTIGPQSYDLRQLQRVIILAAGKAAPGMARGLLPFLDPTWGGLVVLPRGWRDSDLMLPQLEAGHPVPDEASLASGLVWERFASEAGPRDLIIVLLSGGASALLADPVAGITLADMQATTRSLLAAGVPIESINAVRKHVSRIKGGQFAAMAAQAQVATLVLSDVVDDRLDVIASGPTVPDRTTFAEALAIAERVHTTHPLPASVLAHLRAGAAGQVPETPKGDEAFWSRHTITCIGNRLTLLEAARQAAEAEGLTLITHPEPLVGEASEVGRQVVTALRSQADGTPRCWLGTGETTVTLDTVAGKGGRSQELALASAIVLEGQGGIGLLAAGSDGIDGPTPAAGAWADGTSVMNGTANGRDPDTDLAGHDSHGFFAATGGLWTPGPTGTNVGDLVIGLTWPTEGV